MRPIRRGLTAFGRFWWEFLVGDTPELLAATAVVIAVALVFGHHRTAGFVVVPVITSAALALSILRARRLASQEAPPGDLDD